MVVLYGPYRTIHRYTHTQPTSYTETLKSNTMILVFRLQFCVLAFMPLLVRELSVFGKRVVGHSIALLSVLQALKKHTKLCIISVCRVYTKITLP